MRLAPPPPALRRCISGAPPTTSDPWAFSRTGLSSGTPFSFEFLRSRASRIFAFRSSLASAIASSWVAVGASTLTSGTKSVEPIITTCNR